MDISDFYLNVGGIDDNILCLALSYGRVAKLIYESDIDDWRSPFVVNATFAIELYLKSIDRKSTRLNSSHIPLSRMPSSA